jgi:hypothetical protein
MKPHPFSLVIGGTVAQAQDWVQRQEKTPSEELRVIGSANGLRGYIYIEGGSLQAVYLIGTVRERRDYREIETYLRFTRLPEERIFYA